MNDIIQHLAARLKEGSLQGIRCITDSDVSAMEAACQGVPITNLAQHPKIDVAFLEVDEIDSEDPGLACIMGRYAEPLQPQLQRIWAIARAAERVSIVGLAKGNCV